MDKAALVDIINRPWLSKQGRLFGGNRTDTQEPGETPKTYHTRPSDLQAFYSERIQSVAARAEGTAFQSVAVAAIRVLESVLRQERQVAESAMSLGQRERLDRMIETLEFTILSLRGALSAQGEQLLSLSNAHQKPSRSERYWWFALTEAIEALEEGADWMASVVSSQPRGCAARTLSSIVVRLLHRHYYELLSEAEQWMGGNQ